MGRGTPFGHRSSPGLAGSPAGGSYASRMTWALVPDQPNPLTPAMGKRSDPPGQGVGSDVTFNGTWSQSITGFGFSKCRCRGITPCCIASITFIRPAAPAADSG